MNMRTIVYVPRALLIIPRSSVLRTDSRLREFKAAPGGMFIIQHLFISSNHIPFRPWTAYPSRRLVKSWTSMLSTSGRNRCTPSDANAKPLRLKSVDPRVMKRRLSTPVRALKFRSCTSYVVSKTSRQLQLNSPRSRLLERCV